MLHTRTRPRLLTRFRRSDSHASFEWESHAAADAAKRFNCASEQPRQHCGGNNDGGAGPCGGGGKGGDTSGSGTQEHTGSNSNQLTLIYEGDRMLTPHPSQSPRALAILDVSNPKPPPADQAGPLARPPPLYGHGADFVFGGSGSPRSAEPPPGWPVHLSNLRVGAPPYFLEPAPTVAVPPPPRLPPRSALASAVVSTQPALDAPAAAQPRPVTSTVFVSVPEASPTLWHCGRSSLETSAGVPTHTGTQQPRPPQPLLSQPPLQPPRTAAPPAAAAPSFCGSDAGDEGDSPGPRKSTIKRREQRKRAKRASLGASPEPSAALGEAAAVGWNASAWTVRMDSGYCAEDVPPPHPPMHTGRPGWCYSYSVGSVGPQPAAPEGIVYDPNQGR